MYSITYVLGVFCSLVLGLFLGLVFFFFKQKTAYEMRISDWSSDVCSSDLIGPEEKFRKVPILNSRANSQFLITPDKIDELAEALNFEDERFAGAGQIGRAHV